MGLRAGWRRIRAHWKVDAGSALAAELAQDRAGLGGSHGDARAAGFDGLTKRHTETEWRGD
ncbi:MAG: hypothetical protein ACYDB7_07785 [Mycobacteriales bacterium]